MRFQTISLICAFFSAVVYAQSPSQRDAKLDDRIAITGKVERVYHSEKKILANESDTIFLIELKVTKNAKNAENLVGQTIIVRTWQATKRPMDWNGVRGQTEVPSRGDVVEIIMDNVPPLYEAKVPSGIRIVIPGSYKSRSTSMELTMIEPGEFLMGSPMAESSRRSDEQQHKVKITKRYFIANHEVTQQDYETLMATNPSVFSQKGASANRVGSMETKRFPVENVTWYDAVAFCNRLSKRDGIDQYYKITEVKREGDTIVSAKVVIVGGPGYRLPTEAEWEYACRAGMTSPFHYGQRSSASTSNVKALIDNSGYGATPRWQELGRTTHVGSYPANSWGLHDMHGNVAEWCEDWYDKNFYAASPIEDPIGPATGTHKVLRGGSWLVNDASCRSASRQFLVPQDRAFYGGFRVARNP